MARDCQFLNPKIICKVCGLDIKILKRVSVVVVELLVVVLKSLKWPGIAPLLFIFWVLEAGFISLQAEICG